LLKLHHFDDFSTPVVIVGNKTDLHRERVVSTEEGKRLADSWKASFFEVSARSHEVLITDHF
jgi:GTPase SAR1 family protein